MPRQPRIIKVLRKKKESLLVAETQTKPQNKEEYKSKHKVKEKQSFFDKLQLNAEKLKQNPNKSELFLTEKFIEQKFEFEFREIVHGYIPNFYFPKHKKVIVFDGERFRDANQTNRDKVFKKNGIKVHRIDPKRIFRQTDWVMEEILRFLEGKPISRRKRNKKIAANKPIKPEDIISKQKFTLEEAYKKINESDSFEERILKQLKNPY